MPLLICPNCNVGMTQVQRAGVELDICPQCRGVWLDRGELEKLLQPLRQPESVAATAFASSGASPWSQAAQQSGPYGQAGHYEQYDRHDHHEKHSQHGHRSGHNYQQHKGWRSIFDVLD